MSNAKDLLQEPKSGTPTTIRLCKANIARLDEIQVSTGITRNALIGLAITSLIDFVGRTGKLPAPHLKKGKRGGENATA